MTFTVYAICWNEIFLLPHFFKHYAWADRIIIYDNGSDDGSQEYISKQPRTELRHYDSKNEQDNRIMTALKNNCWKGDQSDWVIVCDIDEFLIGQEKCEQYLGQMVYFDCLCWEMVGTEEKIPDDLNEITLKCRPHKWSHKALCFNPRLEEINYRPGCHWCLPVPDNRVKRLLDYKHYVALSEEYLLARYKRYRNRISESDRRKNWGCHYLQSDEAIRNIYKERLKLCLEQLNS